jgi:hypothetical protein
MFLSFLLSSAVLAAEGISSTLGGPFAEGFL